MSFRSAPTFVQRTAAVLAAGLLAVALTSCDDPPVAPESSVLALSANPATVGVQGTSTITATLTRMGGRPVDQGTEVLLNTDLGTVPAVIRTDDRGVATATFFAAGQEGTATVNASSGGATATTTVTIAAARLEVSANPRSVRINQPSTVRVIATLSGQPVAAGTEILMTTNLGAIPEVITTDGRGIAAATFQSQTTGTATVTAHLGSARASVNITVTSNR